MNKNKWFLNGGRGSGKTFRLLCEAYENKIAELEQENKVLAQNLEDTEIVNKALEKENAELKALRESIKDYGAGCYENGLRNGKRKLETQIEKMKWHKVADGDLPKDRHNVYVAYMNGYYQLVYTIASFRHKYWIINGLKTECEVIAWCELPKWEIKEK